METTRTDNGDLELLIKLFLVGIPLCFLSILFLSIIVPIEKIKKILTKKPAL
jgi:RsiW-degrading membrane proteinase PrsW (M82 family)